MSRTGGKVPVLSCCRKSVARVLGHFDHAEVVGGERREQVLEMADLGPDAKPGCVRLPRLQRRRRELSAVRRIDLVRARVSVDEGERAARLNSQRARFNSALFEPLRRLMSGFPAEARARGRCRAYEGRDLQLGIHGFSFEALESSRAFAE